MTSVLLAFAPTTMGAPDDLPAEAGWEPESRVLVKVAPDTTPTAEPSMRAVNGYILVSYLDGPPRRHYVAHDPTFIADQLRRAVAAGQAIYQYWDKPGMREARLERVACRLVTAVEVLYLEPDLDAIFADNPAAAYRLA